MTQLAYFHHYHHGGDSIGAWVAETVARSLIYRTVWAFTRGMDPITLLAVAALVVGILWMITRR